MWEVSGPPLTLRATSSSTSTVSLPYPNLPALPSPLFRAILLTYPSSPRRSQSVRAAEDGTLELKIDAMVEILFNQQLERLWTVGAAAAVTAVRLAGHARDVRALHMCVARRVSACCAMDLVGGRVRVSLVGF